MALAPGTILGQYEIRSPLGAGGMGEVYRAHDTRPDREVAIKVLPESLTSDPDRLRRFEQEARAAAVLNHPNILAVYQMATEGNVAGWIGTSGDRRSRLAHHRVLVECAHARGLAAPLGRSCGTDWRLVARLTICGLRIRGTRATRRAISWKFRPTVRVCIACCRGGPSSLKMSAAAPGLLTGSTSISLRTTKFGRCRERVAFSTRNQNRFS